MKEYELTVLVHPDLEANLDTVLDKVRALVTDNGGEIIKEDNWGKKKLAYEVQKMSEAYYYFIQFDAEADVPAQLEANVRIMEPVLRYLCVRLDAE